MATSLTGLVAVTSDTVTATVAVNTPNITVSGNVITANLVASANITAINIAASGVTNAGTVINLTPTAVPPPVPTQGTIYYDSFMNMLRVYNGVAWGNVSMS